MMDARRYAPAGRPPATTTESWPFSATLFRPLKNTNAVGSVGAVWESEVSFSIVTCEWPLISPASLICCGAMWNVVSGFVKWPVSRLLIAIWIVKFVFACTVAPFGGNTNLEDGMSALAAMMPIGVWLHEPFVICSPFVFSLSGKSRQKLMKLFSDVIDASWPAVGVSWPVCVKLKMLSELSVSDDCAASAAAETPELDEVEEEDVDEDDDEAALLLPLLAVYGPLRGAEDTRYKCLHAPLSPPLLLLLELLLLLLLVLPVLLLLLVLPVLAFALAVTAAALAVTVTVLMAVCTHRDNVSMEQRRIAHELRTPQVSVSLDAGMAEAPRERERRTAKMALAYMLNDIESDDRSERMNESGLCELERNKRPRVALV